MRTHKCKTKTRARGRETKRKTKTRNTTRQNENMKHMKVYKQSQRFDTCPPKRTVVNSSDLRAVLLQQQLQLRLQEPGVGALALQVGGERVLLMG